MTRAHGTHAKYAIDRCRCEPCRIAQRLYNRNRHRQLARPDGVWQPYVDADRAREHLIWLRSCGVGLKSVAKLGGVPHGSLSKIMYGDPVRGMAPSKRIRPATEQKILAVMPTLAAGGQKVPAGPTWRLLDELIARGWSRLELAHRLGQQGQGLQISRKQVRASTARKVEQLHAELMQIEMIPKKTRWGVRPTPAKVAATAPLVSRRSSEPEPKPFPLGPLIEVMGMTESAVCAQLGLNLTRAREGLTEAWADRAALWAGLHPIQIWPDLWAESA